jgi:hypothetical protein
VPVRPDRERVLADLLCDDCLRELPNYRQLIAEVTIERSK